MTKYPFDEHIRAAVLSAVVDLSAPTVAELNGGIDVTCDLTTDGLATPRSESTVDRTRWADDQESADPVRWSTSCRLDGYRFKQPDAEPLFDACAVFRAPVVLVVRYGVRWDEAWTAGDEVEVIRGRWGKRSTAPAARNTAVTFSVPIIVAEDTDAAVVAA